MDIRIHNLTRTFGTLRANDAISLHVAAGNVHGILGENGAGKSTLMKMLAGFLQRDSGEIELDGRPVRLNTPSDGLRAGIGMVYQDPLDIPAFTTLENFYCASPRQALPNRATARQRLETLAATLGFSVYPDARIATLTVGQRQQLEIIRLLACGARVLILDEPTTGITADQKKALFAALKQLASEGNTILFVSHKLEEVAELCNTASVLRAGRVAGEGQMTMPQPQEKLLHIMFGGELKTTDFTAPRHTFYPSLPHPVWRLEQVTLRESTVEVRNLSLDVRAGMVLGLAGLDGSGQQLLLRVLAGFLKPPDGKVLVNGKDFTTAPLSAFQHDGIQYLPADRMNNGLIGGFSLTDHIALFKTTSWLLKKRREAQAEAKAAIADYDIKATPTTPVETLSGGNQQRAMLTLLPSRCTGLLLEHPTRGLDVASALGVWNRLQTRCADGTAIVFTSADLDELLEQSDDVLVFCGGRVSAPIPRSQLTAAKLAELIGGVGFDEAMNPEPHEERA
jgi:simple sugar transport system ATP-binding protein